MNKARETWWWMYVDGNITVQLWSKLNLVMSARILVHGSMNALIHHLCDACNCNVNASLDDSTSDCEATATKSEDEEYLY